MARQPPLASCLLRCPLVGQPPLLAGKDIDDRLHRQVVLALRGRDDVVPWLCVRHEVWGAEHLRGAERAAPKPSYPDVFLAIPVPTPGYCHGECARNLPDPGTPLHIGAGQSRGRRASRPVGRVLCTSRSWPAAIHLGLPLPAASCGLPTSIGRAALKRSRRPCGRSRTVLLTLLRVGFT